MDSWPDTRRKRRPLKGMQRLNPMKVRQKDIAFMNNMLSLEFQREWPSGY